MSITYMIIVLRSTFDLGHNPNNLPLALAQMYLPYTCTEYYHLHKWLCIYVSNTCAYTYDLIISQSCNSVVVNSGWLGFKHNSLSALLILNLMLTICFLKTHRFSRLIWHLLNHIWCMFWFLYSLSKLLSNNRIPLACCT